MKRIIAFILIAAMVMILAGCSAETYKRGIFNLVEKNYDTIVTACEQKDREALLAIDGITEVRIVAGYVLVYCTGTGIVTSSQDYGFYYSQKNTPVTVDCNLDIECYASNLSPEGKGYQCAAHHNYFYTEHIKGNIYFYSNAY